MKAIKITPNLFRKLMDQVRSMFPQENFERVAQVLIKRGRPGRGMVKVRRNGRRSKIHKAITFRSLAGQYTRSMAKERDARRLRNQLARDDHGDGASR